MDSGNKGISSLYKKFTEESNYDFNSRLISFLNYIKAKKNDNISYVIENSMLEMSKPSISEIMVYFNNFEIGKDFEDNKKDDKYTVIYDLEGFVNSENRLFKKERLLSNLQRLKNLGTLIIICDYISCSNIETCFKELFTQEPNVNYLIKSVIAHKTPFLSFISIQKFELKTPVNVEKVRIQLSETINKNEVQIEKINDLSLSEFTRTYEYLFIIQEISIYLKKPIPGKTIKIELKKQIWSECTDFTAYITDSANEELISKGNVSTFLITSSYANDFIYLNAKGRENLCASTNSSRIILVRPSYFINDTPQQMKEFLHAYSSSLFIFEKTNQCKFITLADTNNVVHEVYDDDKILIRDVKDMSKKDFYRQLVLKSSPNEVESEIRIYSISEKDSKSSTFKTIKTNKFFKNKKEKSCIDTYSLINHL